MKSGRGQEIESTTSLHAAVESRFGLVPNFYRLAPGVPEVTEALWAFARSGYLDNPLPALFKERVFVYLSRFCRERYCVVRHIGFLMGLGHPSGHPGTPTQSIDEVLRLIRLRVPTGHDLEELLEALGVPGALRHTLPEPESAAEHALLACATHLYLQSPGAARCLAALRERMDAGAVEHLFSLLTFIRSAHFWSELHPELQFEDDVSELLASHPALAAAAFDDAGCEREAARVLSEDDRSQPTGRSSDQQMDGIEERLHDSQQRYNALIDAFDEGFCIIELVVDEAGVPHEYRFLEVNPAFSRHTGLVDATGKLSSELATGLEPEWLDLYTQVARTGEPLRFEKRAEPLKRWFDVYVFRLGDPGARQLGIVFRDISQHKRIEEALRESRATLEFALESARIGDWDLDLETDTARRSLRHDQCFGYDEPVEEWGFTKFIDHVHPDDRDWVAQAFHDKLDQEDPWKVECRVVWPDGSIHWIEAHGSVYTSGDGKPCRMLGIVNDITDRKRTADAWHDSRERLQAALSGSGAGTFRWNIQTNALDLDENLDRLFGLPPGETVRSLEGFLSVVHPDERAEVIRRCQDCARLGVDFDMEFRVLWPDGSIRWLDDKGKTFRDREGKPAYMAGMCIDITERKQAQQVELRQKQVLELIARAAPLDVVFDHIIRMVEEHSTSGVVASILKLSSDGKHLQHGAAPNLPAAYIEAIDGVAIGPSTGSCGTAAYLEKPVFVSDTATDPLWADYAQLAATHNLRACWSIPFFSSTGQLLGTFALYHPHVREPHDDDLKLVDIATRSAAIVMERNLADMALRDSNERFKALADNIPQLAWMADPGTEGHVLWFNRNWYEYSGTTLEEMLGKGWQKIHHPDHVQRVVDKFSQHVRAGLDWEDIFPLRRHDGEYRWFLSRMKCIRDDEGVTVRMFGTNTDITEQRRLEDELRRLSINLSEADHRKDEFLATLAHELRNPLAPLRNSLSLLRPDGRSADSAVKAHAIMDRQLDQLTRLVDDLMDVSRITQGRINLERTVLRLTDAINSAVEVSQPLIDELDQQLAVTMPDEPLTVHADLTRLSQVFLNLLNNAAKYSDRGSRITVRVEREGDEAVIVISDQGIGIAPDQLDEIFELFMQADRSIDRAHGGLGIGLSLVKRLVGMHGGQIEAHSDGLGKGSRFTVRLPLVDASTPEFRSKRAGDAGSGPLRMLVVDDNRDGADTWRMMLETLGHDVRTAYDGQQALDTAEALHPEVVMLDIGLPVLDGYETCRRMKRQPWSKTAVFIAVTGWGQDEDRRLSAEAGFDHHLVKPVALADLMAILATLRDGPATG